MPFKFQVQGICFGLSVLATVLAWAASMLLVATAILAANVFDYYASSSAGHANLLLLAVFVANMTAVSVLMFRSAYYSSRRIAHAGLAVLCALIIYWLVLCGVSFLWDQDIVCIDFRCPESLWIAKISSPALDNTHRPAYLLQDTTLTRVLQLSGHRAKTSAFSLVGRVILFSLSLLFLLFTGYVLWSWASLLMCSEEEDEEDGYFRNSSSSFSPDVLIVNDYSWYTRKSRSI